VRHGGLFVCRAGIHQRNDCPRTVTTQYTPPAPRGGAGNGSPTLPYTGRLGAGMTTDSSPE